MCPFFYYTERHGEGTEEHRVFLYDSSVTLCAFSVTLCVTFVHPRKSYLPTPSYEHT